MSCFAVASIPLLETIPTSNVAAASISVLATTASTFNFSCARQHQWGSINSWEAAVRVCPATLHPGRTLPAVFPRPPSSCSPQSQGLLQGNYPSSATKYWRGLRIHCNDVTPIWVL